MDEKLKATVDANLTSAVRLAIAVKLEPLAIADAIRAAYDWDHSELETDLALDALAKMLRAE